MTKDSKLASRDLGWLSTLVAAGGVALMLAGCSRWYVEPEHRPGWGGERRVEIRTLWPRAPRPCTQCHTEAELLGWVGLEGKPAEETGVCEPYLLVDRGGASGLDLELVHLPAPGAGPADCRKVVSPIAEEPEEAQEPEPLRQGLYRLVWRDREGSRVPRPIPVWTARDRIGEGEQTPVVLWAGPGEPPEVDIAVVSEAGQSVVVLPVPVPRAGGRAPSVVEPPEPEVPEQPMQVVDVQLRRANEGGAEWIRYELRIDPGDRQVNRAGTRSANASFDEVVCQPEGELILCSGRYREHPPDPSTGSRPDQEFEVRCLDGPPGPCLKVLFSPVARKPAISGP